MCIENVEVLLVVVDRQMHRLLIYQIVDLEDSMDWIRDFLPTKKNNEQHLLGYLKVLRTVSSRIICLLLSDAA